MVSRLLGLRTGSTHEGVHEDVSHCFHGRRRHPFPKHSALCQEENRTFGRPGYSRSAVLLRFLVTSPVSQDCRDAVLR